MEDKDAFFREAFSRNRGLLSPEDQEKIRCSMVAIAGLGGVGGNYVISLARLGVGNFSIADPDFFEIANINRQAGAKIKTLGRKKAEVMEEMIKEVNPFVNVRSFSSSIDEKNADEFLEGCNLLLDGIDAFNIETRRLLFKKAKEKGIYAITAGPLGFSSAMVVFSPTGMGFDQYFGINDKMDYTQKLIAFLVGVAPAGIHLRYLKPGNLDIENERGPSVISTCNLCSALIITETVKIIAGKKKIKSAPHYVQFDPYENSYKKGYLIGGGKNPWMRIKKWIFYKYFTKLKKTAKATTLANLINNNH